MCKFTMHMYIYICAYAFHCPLDELKCNKQDFCRCSTTLLLKSAKVTLKAIKGKFSVSGSDSNFVSYIVKQILGLPTIFQIFIMQ